MIASDLEDLSDPGGEMIELEGNWKIGLAYDVHTLASTYLGPDEFGRDRYENTRSEMGKLVYQLKYRQDRSALTQIVELLDKIAGLELFDYFIPIPPTDVNRGLQPVKEITVALGKRRGVEVLSDCLTKTGGGPELKNVSNSDEREKLLGQSMSIKTDSRISGKKILVVDDLYRSGATLRVATNLLLKAGAGSVAVLTMTKTRSSR